MPTVAKEDHVIPVSVDNDRHNVEQFDEVIYISQFRLRDGEDAYKRYAFNQQASERFPSDRNIMDTRHYM